MIIVPNELNIVTIGVVSYRIIMLLFCHTIEYNPFGKSATPVR